MFGKPLPEKQLLAWLCAGLIPVLLQLFTNVGWESAVACSLLSWIVCLMVWRYGKQPQARLCQMLQYLFIIVLLSQLLPYGAESWKGENYPAVPLILLALAAWSTQKGIETTARVGAVMFWIVLALYLTVFSAGVGEMEMAALKPEQPFINWGALALLLLPCAAAQMYGGCRQWNFRMLLPGLLYIAGTAITTGALTADLTQKMEDPFYEMSRNLQLLGVMQRFEAVVSAGMTAGWFCLICFLLSLMAGCVGAKNERGYKLCVWVSAGFAAGLMLCELHINWWILALLAAVFWVLIPVVTQGLVRVKKS